MNLSKNKMIILVIGILILIMAVIALSYAYFTSTVNTANANIIYNTAFEDAYYFTVSLANSANEGASFSLSSEDMYWNGSDTVAASDTNTFTFNLENNSDKDVVCTYDYIWKWTTETGYNNYTISTGATKEFTVSGPFNEKQVPNYNASSFVMGSGEITATSGNTTTENKTVTTKFYNLANVDQQTHKGKKYKGYLTIANAQCTESQFELEYNSNSYAFSWEAVDGAVSYNIYVDDNLVKSTTSTSIPQWQLYQDSGSHDVYIEAIDSSNGVLEKSMSLNYNVLEYNYGNLGINGSTPFLDGSGMYISNIIPSDIKYINYNSDISQIIINQNYCLINDCNEPYHYYEYKNYSLQSFNIGSTIEAWTVYYDLSAAKIYATPNGCMGKEFDYFQFITLNTAPSPWYQIELNCSCLIGDTEIYVYDEKKKKFRKKKIKDIDYYDNILVWDFDNGQFTLAKPLVIKKKEYADKYHKLEFEDGSVLKIINNHRIFNKELGKFTPGNDNKLTPIGTTTFNSNGEYTKLIKRETIYERVDYYNVVTNYHMNLFTADILTSCRMNNIYPIEEMKFIKDNRKLNKLEDFKTLSKKYFDGFRVAEQSEDVNRDGGSLEYDGIEDYINNNFLKNMK